MDRAIDYLLSLETGPVEPGRHAIDGESLCVLCQEYDAKPIDEGRWQTHRRYVDIQYVVEGIETILRRTKHDTVETECR